jgi:hypothetical protein
LARHTLRPPCCRLGHFREVIDMQRIVWMDCVDAFSFE